MERIHVLLQRVARPLVPIMAFGMTGCDYWPPGLQSEIADLRTALNETMDERMRLARELADLKVSHEAMLKEVEEKARANRELRERVATLTSERESRKTKAATLPSPADRPPIGSDRVARVRPPARFGPAVKLDRASRVREVQQLLRRHDLPLRIDGVYGRQTRAAVRWFQRTRGLAPDGVVGPATYSALQREAGATRLTRLLRFTDPVQTGRDVVALQRALRRAGHRVHVDGRFGPETDVAVTRFQLTHRLSPDGRVGPKTWAALTKPRR